MTDQDTSPDQDPALDQDAALSSIERLRRDWRSSWQAPALIGAGVLLVGAILFSVLTKPEHDPSPALQNAERLIERGRHEEALDVLKTKVHSSIDEEAEPTLISKRYHLAVARALYRAQSELGIDLDVNHRNVLSHYLEAERQEAMLLPADIAALSDTYISLGEMTSARVRADELPDSAHETRIKLYRRLVDSLMARANPNVEQVLEILTDVLSDPGLPPDDRAWALARQTQIRIDQGYLDEAITRLLRAAPRIENASPAIRGELLLLLGRAYVGVSAMNEAKRQLEQAQGLLPTADPLQGDVLFFLSEVDGFMGDSQGRRDRLVRAVEHHPGSRSNLRALMGLGEAQEALGQVEDSKASYRLLVDEINAGNGATDLGANEVSESLLGRYRQRLAREEFGNALAFAGLAGELFDLEETPPDVLASIATANRESAEEILALAGESAELIDLDPSSRAEAQRHMIRAASYYRLHAEAHILTDNDQYAQSLWIAADLFDLAGDRTESIEAFRLYANGVPGDARNAEARYRLGRAFQSLGEFDEAASYFQGLIDDARLGVAAEIGPYAELSHVPLAQALLSDGDEENDEEAIRLLRRMVSGGFGDTETPQFRESLIELGRVRYRQGDFERAIERLEEARLRYPEEERITEIRFLLADSYRLSARQISDQLEVEAMPGSRERELRGLARERRLAAMAGYEQVRAEIETTPPSQRSDLEAIHLRNSYFFLGDCAFDLGDYKTAILHYDRARERYPQDPSSLVAMVQIVNAHIEEGDMGRARTANERARRFYDSLPEDVWDDPSIPMDRRDWERWLDSSSRLYEVSAVPTP